MKKKRKIYATILCDAYGNPNKMIVVEGNNTMTIPIQNSSLKVAKKAARDVFGVTYLTVSLIQGEV